MNSDDEARMLKNWRGRRVLAYHAADMLKRNIDNLGIEDGSTPLPVDSKAAAIPNKAIKRELNNQLISLLRLILVLNDGDVSDDILRGF